MFSCNVNSSSILLLDMINRICEICLKSFSVFPCRLKNGGSRFCSAKCFHKHESINPVRYWLGKKNPVFSKYRKEHPTWNKGKEHPAIQGNKHWNWKGGITKEHLVARTSLKYKLYREAVFARDNWTCQKCGTKGGWNKELHKDNKIQVDHIKSFSKFPELRYEMSNGRTLCFECHKLTDNYCGKAFAKKNVQKNTD